jgi:signal transduction histidine kinase
MDIEKMILITVLSGTLFSLGLILSLLGLVINFRKKRILQNKEIEMLLKNKELELMNAVVLAQENERSKIARNLHDEVGSILSMAQRNLTVTIKDIPENSSSHEDIKFVIDVLDQSVSKIRTISHEILPHFLLKFGLQKTLQRLIEQTQKTLSHPCSFVTEFENETLILEQQQEIQFYSITLELLNNIVKHARPESVNLSLGMFQNNLFLKLEHDGIAISQSDYEYLLFHSSGVGLESISQRLKLISGELLFERFEQGGSIKLLMPINAIIEAEFSKTKIK